MKNILTLSLAITLTLLGVSESHAQWGNKKVAGNGNVTTKTANTSSYDAIEGVGSMDVHLQKGTEGNITVTTDDNLHEYIIIEVKDNKLVLKTKKNTNLKTNKGIHVTVPFQDISKVSMVGSGDIDSEDTVKADNLKVYVTGSGDIVLDVETNTLKAKVTGSGDIKLSGTTRDLEVSVAGSGDFSGFGLSAQNTEASVSGSGDIKVVAKNSIKARVAGSGDIIYKGNPEHSDTKASGSGDINSY
jgi:putative autotransporter adhesin-like protein